MSDLIIQNVIKTKLLVEQHFHGAYGVYFNTASADEILFLAKKLLSHGIGGFFPTLVTDSAENIKRQIEEIKKAKDHQASEMADILGIHLEGIFINPLKKGIHDEKLFLKPTVENYKLFEDDFIKIFTLAPEMDENGELCRYLKLKGVKIQAGHCVGADLSACNGVTHLFNAMGEVSHRETQTALAALVDDRIYTEVIGDGIHLSDDILKLTFKAKPYDKVILVGDTLPIAYSEWTEADFAGEKVFYDGKSITSKEGTIAGSAMLLDDIIKRLAKNDLMDWQFVDNIYKYHGLKLDGCVYWDEDFNVVAVEKDGIVIYRQA